jgi:3-methyladenine DNA glycosylase AlkC
MSAASSAKARVPTLPWAKRIEADPLSMLPLLDALFADPTRFVTRSVANHLNDIAKTAPDGCWAVGRLEGTWVQQARRTGLDDQARATHAGKAGASGGDGALGYDPDAPVEVTQFDVDPASQ